MPAFLFTKKMECKPNATQCATKLEKKIKEGLYLEPLTWHISIYHEKGNNLIFLCFYEKDGEHLGIEKIETLKRNQSMASYNVIINGKTVTRYVKDIVTKRTRNDLVKKCEIKIKATDLESLI